MKYEVIFTEPIHGTCSIECMDYEVTPDGLKFYTEVPKMDGDALRGSYTGGFVLFQYVKAVLPRS